MTTMLTFRLKPGPIADLDAIAAHLASEGLSNSRADAVRWAARQAAAKLGVKKLPEKNKKTVD